MDITPQDNTTQSISDDQELAKALAGVLPDEPEAPAMPTYEQTIVTTTAPAAPVAPVVDPAPLNVPPVPEAPAPAPAPAFAPVDNTPGLDSIKSQALSELRPLIDHVDLPADDRFDAYLMLLRSTDDSTLIAPAHSAAQAISDEKRRAEALLEIIKEIDYLSRKDA
jgi:hypothetical protein